MKLIGYTRVSTDDQLRSGAQSIERVQPAELKRYAKQHRHTLIDILKDDGVSASVPLRKRREGAVLLARLAAGEADGVLVLAYDRLFRDGIDALTVAAALKRRGQTIISIREPIDLATRHGWLAFGIQALMAEHERGADVDRATETSHTLRREGYVYGPVPYGCVRVDTVTADGRTEKQLFRDADTWRVRERIINWHADRVGLRGIARALRDLAIPSPSGGFLWHTGTIKNIVSSHDGLKHIPENKKDIETPVSAGAPFVAVEETCSILQKLKETKT